MKERRQVQPKVIKEISGNTPRYAELKHNPHRGGLEEYLINIGKRLKNRFSRKSRIK